MAALESRRRSQPIRLPGWCAGVSRREHVDNRPVSDALQRGDGCAAALRPSGVNDVHRQRGPRPVLLLALLMLAAGCSSSSSKPAAPTVPTAAAATSVAASTTSTSASVPVTTTATNATTSRPTVPPSTTIPVVDQVRVAAQAFVPYYVACLRKPTACDVETFTAEGSDARAAFVKTIGDLARGGFFVGDEDPGYVVIEAIDVNADHVLVTTCEWSTMVLYGPPASAGGDPLVQNNTNGSTHGTRQWVPEAVTWKIRRTDTISTAVGVNECGPRP